MPTDQQPTVGPAAAACRDVVQVYPTASGSVAALRGIDAVVPAGSITVVVGPSGAGKSTFLRVLSGLERPAVGEVWLGGQATSHLSGRQRLRIVAVEVGYVFQRPGDNVLGYLTVVEHLRMAASLRTGRSHAAVDDVLVEAGLDALRDVRAGDLSAGEQQRVAFAMAVAGGPSLVVADEPTAELDASDTTTVLGFVESMGRQGQSFVLSSHDRAVLAIADQVLVISDGTLSARSVDHGEEYAVIDGAGRVRLPNEALALFPGRRASLSIEDDVVRLREP
jgi:putative ABC transport system ATP-binding protein